MLHVQNLSIKIKNKILLDNVNFEIKQGEIFGIIGESGSGKSLLSSSITRLNPKNSAISGSIFFENKNILSLKKKEIQQIRGKKISMIFQEPLAALNPLQTIRKQISEPLKIHTKKSRKEILLLTENKLNQVGLDTKTISPDLYPHQLSGGQRQRAMIALATILKPKILIADEPTSSLDVYNQYKIVNLLKKLSDEDKISIIFITHDLALLSNLVKNLIILKSGRVIQNGQIDKIFSQRKHHYVKELLNDSNLEELNLKKNKQGFSIIEIKNLTKTYLEKNFLFKSQKKTPTLKGLNLSIDKGECLGIVGPSGCGKTTLAKSVLGLFEIDKGKIIIDNETFVYNNNINKKIRKKIQIVFQDPFTSFNPRHKIKKIISEPFHLLDTRFSKEKKESLLKDLITKVGLEINDLEKYPHEFSGGQRQRIAIARALSIKPDLIVLDEALSSLDVSLKKKIILLLNSLSVEQNLSYLFISHDLNLVKIIANKIIIMNNGEIIEKGKTSKVLRNPRKELTKELLRCSPILPKKWFQKN